MTNLKELLTLKLHSLVSELNADFSAIAFYDPINLEFRWRIAIGSLNDRYTSIVVNSSKGICGRTLKTKREFIVTNFPEELQDEALEFPILIIEELKSAVSVPLLFQSQLIAVLLIGQRKRRSFDALEIERMKDAAQELLQSYIQERDVEKTNTEEKKDIDTSALSLYFINEKKKRGKNLEIMVLDQRITMLSKEAQQSLISIFQLLFDRAFEKENNFRVSVIIELKSEQQFAIQIETKTHLELSEEYFSRLADEVRKINGSIEMVFDNVRTILTMIFFLSQLVSDQLWNTNPHSYFP
ncbi:GAF domain-containing protein [Neobacillus niacini]|uniref:GAF domain-containing protein n=1 Tax=Neobacillus niacini TaxID=86668 RepID=UPI0005EE925B|nr:GAF domain-containing protein [Neobacillus niacini]